MVKRNTFSLLQAWARCSFIAVALAVFAAAVSARAAAPAEIPFSFDHSKIFIDNVYIKGHGPYRATLDTGTSDAIMDVSIMTELGLTPSGRTTARATGGPLAALRVRTPEITSGGVTLVPDGASIVAAAIKDQGDSFEEPSQLIIGYPLFRRNVVEIDFERRVLVIHPAAAYAPPQGAAELDLNMALNLPFAKIEVEGNPAVVMLDTGSNSALDTYPEFMERSGLDKKHTLLGMPVIGMGGAVLTSLLRLDSMRVAGFDFKNIKVYAHAQPVFTGLDGLLGNEIMRRFKVVFDYQRGKAYFVPVPSAMEQPWDEERVGIVALLMDGKYVVVTVVEKSPAEQAGLKINDIIVKIDGKPAKEVGISGLRKLVRGKAGDVLKMTVAREDGKEYGLAVTLADYVK